MRVLGEEEEKIYLAEIGSEPGNWGDIRSIDDARMRGKWVRCRKPDDAIQLYNLSQHLLEWTSVGVWYILKIDNSSNLTLEKRTIFEKIIFGRSSKFEYEVYGPILFDGADGKIDKYRMNVIISTIIFFALLFEEHCHLVSSESINGRRLSLQDGFAYFISSKDADLLMANDMIKKIELNPSISTNWALNLPSDM